MNTDTIQNLDCLAGAHLLEDNSIDCIVTEINPDYVAIANRKLHTEIGIFL